MKKGLILAIIAALISGFSIFYNKLVIVKGIEPSVLNVIKNGGAAFVLSLFIFSARQKRKEFFRLSEIQWFKLFILGIIGGGIPFILFFEGLKLVPATNAAIIQKSMFVWVALIAIPILGEKINLLQSVGYTLLIWSNLFIGGFNGFSGSSGEIMIFVATLFWSVENIFVKFLLKEIDSLIAAWGRMFIGVIFIAVIALFQNKLYQVTSLNLGQILPIFTSIILLTGYVMTWYKSLKTVPATLVTSILVLSTPVTNILSAAFINHNFPQPQIVSLLVSITGVTLITLLSSKFSTRKVSWI